MRERCCATVYAVGEEYRVSVSIGTKLLPVIGTILLPVIGTVRRGTRARAVRVSLAERPYAVRVIVRSFGTFNSRVTVSTNPTAKDSHISDETEGPREGT